MNTKTCVFRCRRIIKNNKIKIEIHTNGGARNVEFWENLGKLSKIAGKNILVIFSVDGLEDTNHIYRRNVKWDKLKENGNLMKKVNCRRGMNS